MYQIVLDNRDGKRYILHDSRSDKIRVMDAICDMELNKTGTLTFRISPTHPNFDKIFKHKSEVYLFQDDECIFCGRVLNDEADIYNFKAIECEGMLGYLLDSVQRADKYDLTGATKLTDYLSSIIQKHNNQVDDYKKFSVGEVSEDIDTSDNLLRISTDEDTLTTLNNNLVDVYNHTYLSASFNSNGDKIINYVNSAKLHKNNQVIKLGKNLLSLTQTYKGEEIATAIIPLGATINSEELENGETVNYRLDITEVEDYTEGTIVHKKGTDYIYDEDAKAKYGLIFKVIEYTDNDSDANKLMTDAIEQLNYYNKLAKSLELNAFDLHLLDVKYDSFRIGQKVRVCSNIHHLDTYMIVQKMSIDINNPDKSEITLGDEERVSIDISSSLSKKTNESDKNINSFMDKDYLNKDYFNSNDYKNKFNDDSYKYLGTDDYKNNYSDLFDKNFKNYLGTPDFNNSLNDFFNSQSGLGGTADLSQYALKTDVQNAFDLLADLLKEV